MSFINEAEREINVKVVFYSAAPGTAAAVVRLIGGRLQPELKLEQTVALEGGFSVAQVQFVPAQLAKLRGFTTRFHLYAVDSASGAVEPDDLRLLVFRGADACFFVGGEGEASALARLDGALAAQGYSGVPIVYGAETSAAAARGRALGFPEVDAFAIDRTSGAGVFEAFKLLAKKLLSTLAGHSVTSRPTPWPDAPPLVVDPTAPRLTKTLEETWVGLDDWQRAYHEKAIWVLGLEESRWMPPEVPADLPEHCVHVIRQLSGQGFTVMSNGLSRHPLSRLELRADAAHQGWQIEVTVSFLGRLAYRAAREGEAPWGAYHIVTTTEEPVFGLEHFLLEPAGSVGVGEEAVTILRAIPITPDELDELRAMSLDEEARAAWIAQRRATLLDRWRPALEHDRIFGQGRPSGPA